MKSGSVYIVAHQDDWQLFMEPHASMDLLKPDHRTVFVYLTAGDAGRDRSYWSQREHAALCSIRYRLSTVESPGAGEYGELIVAGHALARWQLPDGSVQCYFFRLPDGQMAGTGSPRYGKESLARLNQGKIESLHAVDGSTQYDSWGELVETLSALCTVSMDGLDDVVIHHPEWQPEQTPHDHNDHRQVGQCVIDGSLPASFDCWAYQGYNISAYPSQLTAEEMFVKVSAFVAYDQAMLERTGRGTVAEDPLYRQWCVRGPQYRQLRR